MNIEPYLKLMIEENASDIFFTVNADVKIKTEGEIRSVGKTVLTSELIEKIADSIMDEYHKERFSKDLQCDFSISFFDSLSSSARFRANVFRQRGDICIVIRFIPGKIPTFQELGLPEILAELIMKRRGLLLIVGGTSSGKSTTMAAMVNHRNQSMAGHILTIEDPIEFSHPNLKSIVSQREVGVDTKSYPDALKSAMREAPDVVLVGEIRDRETMEAALELANTGHLVIATMHAVNADQAIDRVINLFPQELHKRVFTDLSLSVHAIISQRLVLNVDNGRCAAFEILIKTPYIAELILKGDVGKIKTAMSESGQYGMQTFDAALLNLYREGRIVLEEALSNADSRSDLESKINFS